MITPDAVQKGRFFSTISSVQRFLILLEYIAMLQSAIPSSDFTQTESTSVPSLSSVVIDSTIGNTPLVRLQRLAEHTQAIVLAKLEGNNPAGSVKDRPAYNMIMQAELRGDIKVGDTLIEATSGNTGIALAMVAAMRGYRMILIMPDNSTQERKDAMLAYGATLIEVPAQGGGMEAARDLAVIALAAQHLLAFGLGILLLDFGADGDDTAVDGHMDVVSRHTGQLCGDGVGLRRFLHIDFDLTRVGQRVSVQGAHVKTGRQVFEKVVKQTATRDQGVHAASFQCMLK